MTNAAMIKKTNAFTKIKVCYDKGITSSADIMKQTKYSYKLVIKTLNVILNENAENRQARADFEYQQELKKAAPEDFSKPSGASFDQLLMFSESNPLVIRQSHPNHKS